MSGIKLITAERKRQVSEEGWTPEHDDEHALGEMAMAAVCYTAHAGKFGVQGLVNTWVHGDEECGCREADCPHRFIQPIEEVRWRDPWPWDEEHDKRHQHDQIRCLVIAGALIAAEIDRLQRIPPPEPSND